MPNEISVKLTEAEKAYLAGIIDGEGCLYIGATKTNTKKYSPVTYSSMMSVEMGCQAVPQWIFDRVGGSLHHRTRQGRNLVMWTWKTDSRGACSILEQIYPYLVEKKKEAEAFLEYRQTIRIGSRSKLTEDEVVLRDSIIAKLKASRKVYYAT